MSLMLRRYVHACAGLNATNVTVPLGTPNPMVFPNLYHLISRLSNSPAIPMFARPPPPPKLASYATNLPRPSLRHWSISLTRIVGLRHARQRFWRPRRLAIICSCKTTLRPIIALQDCHCTAGVVTIYGSASNDTVRSALPQRPGLRPTCTAITLRIRGCFARMSAIDIGGNYCQASQLTSVKNFASGTEELFNSQKSKSGVRL